MKVERRCAWCLVEPLENIYYGLRLCNGKCYHKKNNIIFFYELSAFNICIIVVFHLLTIFSTYFMVRESFMKNLGNKIDLTIRLLFILLGIMMTFMTIVPAIVSRATLPYMKKFLYMLCNPKIYGYNEILTKFEYQSLQQSCKFLKILTLSVPFISIIISTMELFIEKTTNFSEKILITIANYFFYAIVTDFQIRLTLFNVLNNRPVNIFYNRMLEKPNKKIIQDFQKYYNKIYVMTNTYLRETSLIVFIGVSLFPFLMVIFCNFWFLYVITPNTSLVDLFFDNLILMVSACGTVPLWLYLIVQVDGMKKTVSVFLQEI